MTARKKILIASSVLISASFTNAQKPNIILVLADDLGYGDISALNPDSKINTPNIDKLASDGIMFSDAHAASALSTPSRYAILTGRYPWRSTLKEGTLGGYSQALISPDRSTIASMLSNHGYKTACIGKWHLGWDWSYKKENRKNKEVDFSLPISNGPTTRGFDYFYGLPASLDMAPYIYVENNIATSLPNRVLEPQKGLLLMHGGVAGADFNEIDCFPNLIRRSVQYIDDQNNSSTPFFLYLPITAPHTPVLPTAQFLGKTSIGDYGDFVLMIDDMIRQIVDALKRNNQLENTIIIFTSDNGCAPYAGIQDMESKGHFPSYIFRGYKADVYEGGHRIPLIISWEGKFSHKVDNSLVSLSDFYATFAEMLEYKMANNEAEDSFSLWPILMGKGKSSRKDIVSASGNGFLSIRTPELKLVFTGGSGGWSYPRSPSDLDGLPPMQLFDIKTDPSEKNNLINTKEYSKDIKMMKRAMRKYLENGRSTSGKKVQNDTKDDWSQTQLILQ